MFCNILANIEEHYMGYGWQYLTSRRKWHVPFFVLLTFFFISIFTTTLLKILDLWLPIVPKVDLQAKQIDP